MSNQVYKTPSLSSSRTALARPSPPSARSVTPNPRSVTPTPRSVAAQYAPKTSSPLASRPVVAHSTPPAAMIPTMSIPPSKAAKIPPPQATTIPTPTVALLNAALPPLPGPPRPDWYPAPRKCEPNERCDTYDYDPRRWLRGDVTQTLRTGSQFEPQASRITDGVYITDLYTATSRTAIGDMAPRLTQVISVHLPDEPVPIRSIKYGTVRVLRIPVEDEPTADLYSHFEEAVACMERAVEGGGMVLVHSVYGRSRAAAIVAAYFIARCNMTLKQALELIEQRRPVTHINNGFIAQLEKWEKKIRPLHVRVLASLARRH
ncbi:phosphatases II [Artomyces pyxidatus]|uniref:Phosphatases II n=1 Tax=Artomyces pyxidatus TaxID=48021 RepID=A0ACB8SQG6_9AGAM|nr:phosphatases II [Artomyces pyxidatus]